MVMRALPILAPMAIVPLLPLFAMIIIHAQMILVKPEFASLQLLCAAMEIRALPIPATMVYVHLLISPDVRLELTSLPH
jgi:hypothetical protein